MILGGSNSGIRKKIINKFTFPLPATYLYCLDQMTYFIFVILSPELVEGRRISFSSAKSEKSDPSPARGGIRMKLWVGWQRSRKKINPDDIVARQQTYFTSISSNLFALS